MANADPDYIPSHRVILTESGRYDLRPRTSRKVMAESPIDDSFFDGESLNEDNDNLVITISQMKKRKEVTPSPAIVTTSNAELPNIPFPVTGFEELFRLATMVSNEGHMFKDCQRLPVIYPALCELNSLIGLRSTKDGLCNVILHELLQQQPTKPYWRNFVITGPPGVGKTSVAKIIAKLLNLLGRTPSDEITVGNPLNMISDYEGQTKSEVNRVVHEALSKSGVLFIDEAPSLNDGRNKDSYGRKCLDMLMQLMDKHIDRLVVIFAGYKEDMEKNVIQANAGFRRRIQWFIEMDGYGPEELHEIFLDLIRKNNFELSSHTAFNVEWFTVNHAMFPFFGGSIENLVEKIKIIHTRKVFGMSDKRLLTDDTVNEGFALYVRYTVEPLAASKARVDEEESPIPKTPKLTGQFSPLPLTSMFLLGQMAAKR